MPLIRSRRTGPPPSAQQEPADDVGALRKWLAAGTRVGSGIFGAAGGPLGAASAGIGEGIAEALEGSLDWNTSPSRIAVETGIGAVPFSRVAKLGKAGASAVRSGVFSGAGDVGRQWAEGNFEEGFAPQPDGRGWNYGRTALATGLGGLTGGVLGHFFHTPAAPKAQELIVENMGGGVPRTKNTPGASVPAGRTVRSAGMTTPGTDQYSGGVTTVRGYDPRPTSTVGPPTLPSVSRVPYGDVLDEGPSAERSLEEEMFGVISSMSGKRSRDAMELDDIIKAQGAERARVANRVEAVRQADTQRVARETTLSNQFDDALTRKYQKLDKADRARELIQRNRTGDLEAERTFTSSISSETPSGVKETMVTKFKTPKGDESDEGVSALQEMLSTAKTPEAAKTIEAAARGVGGRTTELLKNLDEEGMKYFTHLRNVMGETDSTAYKKAIYEQQVRQARGRTQVPVEPTESPIKPTPNTVNEPTATQPVAAIKRMLTPQQRGVVKQSAHPSFYETGFEGLEEAAPRAKTPPPGPPAGSAAAQKLASAEQSYQPEAFDELKRLSAIYNDPKTPPAGKKEVGKQLRQLAEFMEGRGKYAPKGDSWVQEASKAVDSLNPKGQKGIGQVEAIVTAALGLGGGAAGAAIDASEGTDPVIDGALLGLGSGVGIALAPALARSVGGTEVDLQDAGRVRQMAVDIANKIPQVQRASLLASTNLPANAWLGPWGSVVTALIEDILKGNHQRALPALREVWNPLSFAQRMYAAKDEAYNRLISGELGRDAIDDRLVGQMGDLSMIDRATILPGWAMTAGDVEARRVLEKFGYSADEARQMTLTSEPTSRLGRQIANMGKGSWLGNMFLPFKRTPANIMEQGAQRLPFIGPTISRKMGRDLSGREAFIEQTLGGVVGYGAYEAAENAEKLQPLFESMGIDVSGQDIRRGLRAYVTNPAGRYSLPAALGWITGDAVASGKDADTVLTDPFTYEQTFPLPTTEAAQQIGKSARNVIRGEVDSLGDVVPRSLSFEALRKLINPLTESVGLPVYTEPKPRGLRRARGPRRSE